MNHNRSKTIKKNKGIVVLFPHHTQT